MNDVPASGAARAQSAPSDPVLLHHEVSQWLYREARMLDEEKFRDWLGLLAPEIHYWMPMRENRFRGDRRSALTPATSASVFNDDLHDLELRIKRFDTGLVWSEDPAPRVTRSVTNVEVSVGDEPQTLDVHSVISILRSRRQDEEVTFNARRQDRFCRINGAWRLARRHIFATHHVFLDENVSLFF